MSLRRVRIRLLGLLCLLIVLWQFAMAQGDPPDALLSEAADLYQQEDFTRALEIYESLRDQGYISHALQYNLGNCYYQEARIAESILAYERALLLQPGDQDVLHNLSIAQNAIEDRVPPVDPFFINRWLTDTRNTLSVKFWGILSLVFLWGIMALSAHRLWHGIGLFPYAKGLAFLLGVACIICFLFAWSAKRNMDRQNEAIVLVNANLFEAPSTKSESAMRVSAGEKVRILDSLEMLYKVELANTEQGWIDATALEKI